MGPVHVLTADNLHEQAAALREQGGIVPVELPGKVVVWAVTRHSALEEVLAHPDVKKNPKHWRAWQRGEIPRDWPLITFVDIDSMFVADDADHARLRTLVSKAFTPRRVETLRPRVTSLVAALLDGMGKSQDGVDLKQSLSLPLPMTVISELFGVDEHDRTELHELISVVFDQTATPARAAANHAQLEAFLTTLIQSKRDIPADDMTSALIAARDGDGDRLSERELTWTLPLMVGAGYETTMNLLTNAIRALLTHPRQLALVREGRYPWSAVVEETLRWDPPIANLPFCYTSAQITMEGVTLPAGEALLMCYGSAGRDPAQHGPDAHLFDITRTQQPHLAFSRGPHFCLGASLARMEAGIALPMLFERFPNLTLAADEAELEPVPSLVAGGIRSLPVRL